MATYTTNYSLKKPAPEDFYNVQDQNDNMDIIDGALDGMVSDLSDLAGAGRTTETVKGNADAIANKASTTTYTATITTTWTGSAAPYSQSISVSGITATDNPIVDIDLSSAADYAAEQTIATDWAKIYRIVTGTDAITVYATEETTVATPIQLKVVR